MISVVLEIASGLLILAGSLFTLAAAIGIVRFPDFYSRMHAASKAGSVGSGAMLIALALYIGDFGVAMRATAGVVFFLLTAPISAHLLSRAAYLAGLPMWQGSVIDELKAAEAGRAPLQDEHHLP